MRPCWSSSRVIMMHELMFDLYRVASTPLPFCGALLRELRDRACGCAERVLGTCVACVLGRGVVRLHDQCVVM